MKVGGLRELPTVRDAVRRRRRAPKPVQVTSDAPYPRSVERRSAPRAPLHFQRIELKYFLPYRYLDHFVERVSRRTDIDPFLVKEGRGRTRYPVTSLYFDSWDLAAWREKEDGQFFRRKIRLRTYTETFSSEAPCFLEIKRRLDAVVLKDRLRLPPGVLGPEISPTQILGDLLARAEGHNPTAHEAQMLRGWLNLQPTAIVRYQRTALVAKEDANTRITVDHDLAGAFRPATIIGDVPLRGIDNIAATGMNALSGKYALLEIKSNNVIPAWLHEVIQDMELARTAYSKYYLVVLALRAGLHEDCDPSFVFDDEGDL